MCQLSVPDPLACTVHPHVCGERKSAGTRPPSFAGSSPRVWGAPHGDHVDNERGRFIPTCVGSAISSRSIIQPRSVHPHVCGERKNRDERNETDLGSSPRVWGALQTRCACSFSVRFIPTCVGSAL